MAKTYEVDTRIECTDLAPELCRELDAEGFEAYECREMDGGFLTGNVLHIAFHPGAGRAGIVYVGSGSSGVTSWTDASSPGDALRRYLDDDMAP